jgi:hypothetical protein
MLTIVLEIVVAILKVLIPAWFDSAVNRPLPTAETGAGDPLRDALRTRVKDTWGRAQAGGACLLILACLAAGCAGGSRTVYVSSGEPVRLRETIHGAAVWALDSQGTPTPGTMDIPEGWYALPVPGVGDNLTR